MAAVVPGLDGQPNPLAGPAEQTLGRAETSLGTLDIEAGPVEANVAGPTGRTAVPDVAANGVAASGFTTVLADIPADYLALYNAAATTCSGLHWSVLAAIGKIESNHGRSTLTGVHTAADPRRAKGPMQLLQATFDAVIARHAVPAGGATPPSPHNPHDAIHTAAAHLCDSGARDDRDLRGAIYTYNPDDDYVSLVLANALDYRQAASDAAEAPQPSTATPAPTPTPTPKPTRTAKPSETPKPSAKPKPSEAPKPARTTEPSVELSDQSRSAARTAIEFAQAQIGKPYVWGGNGNPGYDCSGLTTAAYAAAKIRLPRTAQTQYNHGPRLPAGATLQPGDLLFFGTPRNIHHVGIFLGGTRMIHAPTFGKTVRIMENFHDLGDYAGASRPAASSSV